MTVISYTLFFKYFLMGGEKCPKCGKKGLFFGIIQKEWFGVRCRFCGYEERTGKNRRFTLGEVTPIAQEILKKLESIKHVKRVSPAGSLRRMKETVGDIDILIETAYPEKVINEFTSFSEIKKVLESGKTKVSVILKGIDIQMDLRILPGESYGAAL